MIIHILSICLLGCQVGPKSHHLPTHNRVVSISPMRTASPVSQASLTVATGSYQAQGNHQQHRLVARSPQYSPYDGREPRDRPRDRPRNDQPRDRPRDAPYRDQPYRDEIGYRGDYPQGGGPYGNGYDDREAKEARRREKEARRERAREREMREAARDRDRNYRGATVVVPYRPTYSVLVTPRPTYPVVVPRPTYLAVASPRPVYPLTQIVPAQPRTVYSVQPRPLPVPVTVPRPVTITVPGTPVAVWEPPVTVNVPAPVVTVSVHATPVTVTQLVHANEGPSGLETIDSEVQCRQYPDLVSTQFTEVVIIPRRSKVSVDCWTNSLLPGALGGQRNSNVWLHVNGASASNNCWLHEKSFSRFGDLRALPFCQPPDHHVAALQPQYSKLDYCYDRPSLDAPSRPLGSEKFVDVVCHIFGEDVRGNRTWVKALRGCYFPGQMFDTAGWFGSGLPNC